MCFYHRILILMYLRNWSGSKVYMFKYWKFPVVLRAPFITLTLNLLFRLCYFVDEPRPYAHNMSAQTPTKDEIHVCLVKCVNGSPFQRFMKSVNFLSTETASTANEERNVNFMNGPSLYERWLEFYLNMLCLQSLNIFLLF